MICSSTVAEGDKLAAVVMSHMLPELAYNRLFRHCNSGSGDMLMPLLLISTVLNAIVVVACDTHTMHCTQQCIFDGGQGGGWTRCISNFFCSPTTCSGHGTCVDEPINRNANITKAFLNCTCDAGYSGRFCEVGP
jgi:EGF-like domain